MAVQSKFLAVGAFVPWARGGVGAVATQAFAEITYGNRGLELLESGLSPEHTIDRLTAGDEMSSHRQVGMVAADGSSASYTGEDCFEHAVSVTGDGFAAQGDILSNAEVPEAIALPSAVRPEGWRTGSSPPSPPVRKRVGRSGVWSPPRCSWSGPVAATAEITTGGSICASTTPTARSRTWALSSISTRCTSAGRTRESSWHSTRVCERRSGDLDSLEWGDVSAPLEDNLQGWLGWHNLEETLDGDGQTRSRGPDRVTQGVHRVAFRE